jgi:hypothetical protein
LGLIADVAISAKMNNKGLNLNMMSTQIAAGVSPHRGLGAKPT